MYWQWIWFRFLWSSPYLRNLKNASGGMIEDLSSAWRIWGRYIFLVISGIWSDDLRPAKFESLLEHKIIWCSVTICKVKVMLQFLKLIKFCKNKTNKLRKYAASRRFFWKTGSKLAYFCCTSKYLKVFSNIFE